MKKRLFALLIIVIASVAFFAACDDNDNTTLPNLDKVKNIRIENGSVHWDSVGSGVKYTLDFSDVHIVTDKTSAELPDGYMNNPVGVYPIRVTAARAGYNSSVSDENFALIILGKPTGLGMNGNLLQWNKVENALGYRVVDQYGEEHFTNETSVDITAVGGAGEKYFSVYALGNGNNIIESGVSDAPFPVKLLDNLNYSIVDRHIIWQANPLVAGYSISFDGAEFVPIEGLKADLRPLLGKAGEHEVRIKSVSAGKDNDGNVLYDNVTAVKVQVAAIPQLSVADGMLNIDGVDGNRSLEFVVIDEHGNEKIFDSGAVGEFNSDNIPSCNGTVSVRVKETTIDIGNKGFIGSDFCEPVAFSKLAKPDGAKIDDNGMLVWNGTPDCNYILRIDGAKGVRVSEARYDLSGSLLEGGVHKANITALSYGENIIMSDSTDDFVFNVLHTPELRIDNREVTWDGIDNADGYLISIDGGEDRQLSVTESMLENNVSEGEHSVKVRAFGKGYVRSKPVTVKYSVLKAPKAVTVDGRLTWNEVANSSGYVLVITGESDNTVLREEFKSGITSFDHYGLPAGRYGITVMAKGDNSVYFSSVPSGEVSMNKLSAPQNLTIENNSTLKWDAVDGANGYEVQIRSLTAPSVGASMGLNEFRALLGDFAAVEIKVRATGDSASVLYSDYGICEPGNGEIFYSGDGTETSPYVISTAEQFKNVKDYPDSHFLQINNINLRNESFETFENFSGRYDGAGYEIANVVIGSRLVYSGLWGVVGAGAVIENLTLKNVNLSSERYGDSYIGILAGKSEGAEINNVNILNSSIILKTNNDGRTRIGGLFGADDGSLLSNITVNVSVTVDRARNAWVGGIVGYAARETMQGVTLSDNRILNGAVVTADIKVISEDVNSGYSLGGAFGYISGGVISNLTCSNSVIKIVGQAGELNAGLTAGNVIDSKLSDLRVNNGKLSAGGGIIGACYVGGVLGKSVGTDVERAGADALTIDVKIENASKGGTVKYYIGGFAGASTGSLTDCSSDTLITYCNTEKTRSVKTDIGGFLAESRGKIANVISTDKIVNNTDAEILALATYTERTARIAVEIGTESPTGVYYLNNGELPAVISGAKDGTHSKTLDELKNIDTYREASWDFQNVWELTSNHTPVLKPLPQLGVIS